MKQRARSDADMQQDVRYALRADPVIASAPIEATVHDGIVSLHGHVWGRNEKIAATAAAASVAGVRGVIADIEIRTSSEEQRSDTAVRSRALRALDQHPFVPRGSITIAVDRGVATLRGVVAYEHQRLAAEHAMLDLHGITKVLNRIQVAPEQSLRNAVESAIEAAFTISGDRDPKRITASGEHGTIVLRGTVPTWTARDVAERAARHVEGVRRVLNLVIVRS